MNIEDLEGMFTVVPEEFEEDREILNTRSMLEQNFIKELQGLGTTYPGTVVKTASADGVRTIHASTEANSERILLALYEVRDGLIDTISGTNLDSDIARGVASHINKVGACINSLGGKVESFDPLVHVSGLHSPNLFKNAERVAETTKQCYSLGSVESIQIAKDGRVLRIIFAGSKGEVYYKASGLIIANKTWTGNEAVDYIYTPGEGRMSVKAFDDGKWVDKSDDFSISWELAESKEPADLEETQKEEGNENKKEEVNSTSNNIKDDFPIIEK